MSLDNSKFELIRILCSTKRINHEALDQILWANQRNASKDGESGYLHSRAIGLMRALLKLQTELNTLVELSIYPPSATGAPR